MPRHRSPKPCIALLLTLLFLLSPGLVAQDIFQNPGSGTGANLLATQDDFLPVEQAFRLDTRLDGQTLVLDWWVAPGYYLYQERFVFRVEPPFPLEPLFEAGITKYDEFFEKDMTVFYDRALIKLPLPGDATAFHLYIESQGCADAGLCYPPYSQAVFIDPGTGEARVVAVDDVPARESTHATTESSPLARQLLLNLGFALIAGIILNAMPCVFPVLSIKIISLTQADRTRLPLHGWAYTLGVVGSFLLFAIVLLVARTSGEALGWGFQLQSPWLVTGLVYLFFVMGLSLSGLVNLGTSWMGAGQQLTQQSGLGGSFFTGVLAAVVASPCTAPFMGVALGFALTQPAAVSLGVFGALGLGMALPLLLLCHYPALAHRLPRPGPWMDNLKQFLAFPLYLSALWLLWVLGRQTSVDALIAVSCGLLALALGFWLLSRPARGWLRWPRLLLLLACWITALWLPLQNLDQRPDERWQSYSPERLQELRAQGRPVFVNLTADWCLTCLANERLTLSTADVEAAFDQAGVATLKGDWTNSDPRITALLQEYGRSGVPLYLWFPPGHQGKAEILPQILNRSLVIDRVLGGSR